MRSDYVQSKEWNDYEVRQAQYRLQACHEVLQTALAYGTDERALCIIRDIVSSAERDLEKAVAMQGEL